MTKLVKELKTLMKQHGLSREKVSRILDCSSMTVHRWLKDDFSPSIASTRKIKEGISKIRELYPESTYDMVIRARNLYRKIKRQVTNEEKIKLFDINREKGLEAYIAGVEELVKKYGKDKD